MSEAYVGEIRMFAGTFAPAGWLMCDGQLLSIAEHDVLFALVGTTYGGNGMDTFALPDLRSRIPIGSGPSRPIGSAPGQESVTLLQSHLPAHTHHVTATSAAATATSPQGHVWAAAGNQPYAASANTSMSPAALTATGGSQPHENRPPFLALNFIICEYGIFPSRAD